MRRLALACSLLLVLGCPNPEDDDGGTPDTGTPDVKKPEDSGTVTDASSDTGIEEDAGADAGGDSGVDSGTPDSGDPCAPIPQADLPAEVTAVLGRFVERCIPELGTQESNAIGGWVGVHIADILQDEALIYDDVAAGLCACDLEAIACDTPDPFRVLGTCAAVITGTIAEGDVCTGYRCQAGLECWRVFEDAPPSCLGTCVAPVENGGDCAPPRGFQDPYPCEPGLYCFDDQEGALQCEPLRQLGESCDFQRRCAGDRDAFILPTTQCDTSTTTPTCVPRGRDQDDCTVIDCFDLYRCNGGVCELKPGPGEACDLPYPTPTQDAEWVSNAFEGREACRVNPTNANPATYCILTSSTAGQASCATVAGPTETCGMGVGLSPACQGLSRCEGIDTQSGTSTGTCADRLAAGAACDNTWDDSFLGPQCQNGTCDWRDPSVCAPHNPNGICIND